jgi:hypothetical protein
MMGFSDPFSKCPDCDSDVVTVDTGFQHHLHWREVRCVDCDFLGIEEFRHRESRRIE